MSNQLAAAARDLDEAISKLPGGLEGYLESLDSQLAALRAELAAHEAAKPEQEPLAWLVCSVNKDGSLSLEHATAWRESAHEHINDAINSFGIREAARWVVRPAYAAPVAVASPLSDEQINNIAAKDFPSRWWAALCEFARAIEAAHGIKEQA